ncbi:enolase [Striga asiatica]|uniref:Enolase n=1 Tax=Striga asiatica TaxID=4170 RepID=A0A5A7P513_STRAF|nr:enolase [Striga asiatica]
MSSEIISIRPFSGGKRWCTAAMASQTQRLMVLLLLFLVVSTTAVPTTRSLKEVKNRISIPNLRFEDGMDEDNNGDLRKLEGVLGKRMNLELHDYAGTLPNCKNLIHIKCR